MQYRHVMSQCNTCHNKIPRATMNHPLSHIQHCLQSLKLELLTQQSTHIVENYRRTGRWIKIERGPEHYLFSLIFFFNYNLWLVGRHLWLKIARKVLGIVLAEILKKMRSQKRLEVETVKFLEDGFSFCGTLILRQGEINNKTSPLLDLFFTLLTETFNWFADGLIELRNDSL